MSTTQAAVVEITRDDVNAAFMKAWNCPLDDDQGYARAFAQYQRLLNEFNAQQERRNDNINI